MPEMVKHRKYARNSRALYTGKGGYYKVIYEVVVLVETLIDGALFEWTCYVGYCPEWMDVSQAIETVAEYGDKIYPDGKPYDAYDYFSPDKYPKELFRE